MADEDWFWQSIDAARPSLAVLEAWLMAQPKDVVARFGRTYQDAASDLADYSTGMDGDVWSEDDMEDLCRWVVGRGRAFWESVETGRLQLREAARLYSRDPEPWLANLTNPALRGYAAPGSLAAGVYWTRFGEVLDVEVDPD
jgi:hypothetical protein